MKLNDVKLLLVSKVKESNLSSKEKAKLYEFIGDANELQTKHLLLYGTMTENITEKKAEQINEMYKSDEVQQALIEAGGRVAKLRKSYMTQVGSGGGLNPFWLLYRKVRSALDACTKRCGKYELNTTRRQHCMLKCKLDAAKAHLAAAQKAKDESQIKKAKEKLAKAQKTFNKSMRTFSKRGAEAPN